MYIKALYGETAGSLPEFDYKSELALWDLVIEANKKGLLKSAKDVNVGGLAIALSKMAAVSGKGASVQIALDESKYIFDESQSRAVLEVSSENVEAVVRMAMELGVKVTNIGTVGGESVRVNDVELSVEKVKDIYFNTFARTIEQDL